MPTSVARLAAAANLELDGVVLWGSPIPCTEPGVYIVSLDPNDATTVGMLTVAPLSRPAVTRLLSLRPELTLDGHKTTADALLGRLHRFWLPDEVVLYVGLAGTSLADRVNAYHKTPLGARSPHAGGWFLKTLAESPARWVHWARSPHPGASENDMLRCFCGDVTESTRRQLLDPAHPFPFANLEWPPGVRKRHGIAGARAPRIKRPAGSVDPITVRSAPEAAGSKSLSGIRRRSPGEALTSPLRSQQVTANDRRAGQIRVPSESKRAFPRQPGTVSVILRGRLVSARWNPRIGPDRERSGTLGVGAQLLADLVPIGTILVVTPLDGGAVELA